MALPSSPQQSAWQRGIKISKSLGGFYTLLLILGGLMLLMGLGAFGFEIFAMGKDLGVMAVVIYTVTALGILLTLGGMALFLRVIRTAKAAIATTASYAGQQDKLNAGQIETLNKWLSIWQWFTVVMGIVGAVVGFGGNLLSGLIAGTGDHSQALSPVIGLLTGIGSVIRSVVQVVITWLILAAIKDFFGAVGQHAAGQRVAVSPFAQKVSNWMIFTLVILILFGLLSLLGYLGLTVGLIALSQDPKTHIGGWALLPLLLILPVIAVQIWEMVLVAWSGSFAKDVGVALDQSGSEGGNLSMNTANPWAGAAIEQQR